ncbi:M23 family metallopeptidase [Candidatus Collierbacteria bacterium]|nr:M23 family metallopeptidase [Candidatus Collierbacteria bacterium]
MLWKKSHFLSKKLRPVFESRKIKAIVGGNLALSIFLVNLMGPIGGQTPAGSIEVTTLTPDTVKVITETTFRIPLAENNGYSQGFYDKHPGVDIKSKLGTKILAAAPGTVIEVERKKMGYGHKLVIGHSGRISTLYAHLDTINVNVGDYVTKETVLGTVGLTGWTTGPHLHFEVRNDSGYINPKQILPEL